ncbi:MAG: hypothetical protein ACRCVG_07195 [Methanobacteriaceae archaeon]
MGDYDKFLDLLENGWEGNIESADISVDMTISTAFNNKRMNPFDAIASDKLNRKIDANFKVYNDKIIIQLIKSKKCIKIPWDNIINVSRTEFNAEVLLKLKNSSEIIISPPFVKKVIFKHYFTDYFIDYITEQIEK